MPIKDLLVHVDNSEACKNRIAVAQKIAEPVAAHITGIYTYQLMVVPSFSEFGAPAYVYTELEAANKDLAEQAETVFNESMAAWQSKKEWQAYQGEQARNIARAAANYDLVVMGQYNPDDELDRSEGLVAQVAISAGRPVLVTPHSAEVNHVGKRILVAWNGEKEAARAVHDAMPLLHSADAVEIVHITRSDEDEIPCADIAVHLTRHGIPVEAGNARTKSRLTGEAILYLAQSFGADLIVMGAYGHTRLRELIIGGATRHVLENTTVPVLMSH